MVGSISYIGLIVPNIVAMFKGDKIRGTLVDTALFGAIFVLVCDMIARVVIAPYELPIELIVGIIGSVLFIGLLLYRLKHGRKAIRLGAAHSGACASAVSQEEGGRAADEKRRPTAPNLLKLGVMALLALAACAAYLLVDINPKYFDYADEPPYIHPVAVVSLHATIQDWEEFDMPLLTPSELLQKLS